MGSNGAGNGQIDVGGVGLAALARTMPVLGLIHLHRSMWTCTSNITGAGPS